MNVRVLPGPMGACELAATGLLQEAETSGQLPVCGNDLVRWLQQDGAYAMIGYRDDFPIGYVAFMIRTMEHGIRELFTLQVYNAGRRADADAGFAHLEAFARRMDCARIGTMLPVDVAEAHVRRFRWTPVAIYATRMVRPHVS